MIWVLSTPVDCACELAISTHSLTHSRAHPLTKASLEQTYNSLSTNDNQTNRAETSTIVAHARSHTQGSRKSIDNNCYRAALRIQLTALTVAAGSVIFCRLLLAVLLSLSILRALRGLTVASDKASECTHNIGVYQTIYGSLVGCPSTRTHLQTHLDRQRNACAHRLRLLDYRSRN